MNIVSISHNKFRELKKLELSKKIMNTEGTLYRITDKNKWQNEEKVIKKFYNDFGDSFGNKLLTINSLVDLKEKINIEEIVMPEKLVVSNGQIIGFTMDYIENINLKDMFYDLKIDRELIIKLLKEIGTILEKIKKLNEHEIVENFYLNDLHESNFIYNLKTKHINVVDIDSCRISNNKPFAAKFLTPVSPVSELPGKYQVCELKDALGYIEPNMNSDLYCYTIMIMNYLYKGDVQKLDIPEFYSYLNYLNSIGFPYELLDCFSNLYEYTNNTNPMELLDMIPKDMGRAHHKVYELVK